MNIPIALYNDLSYQLSTSNAYVKDFEKLAYHLDVIKDQNPTVKVDQILDSININQSYFTGQAADDYGLSKIRLVCYPSDNEEEIQRITLESPNSNVHQFYYTFPSGLKLVEGKSYKLYFEVVDNDGIRGGKITRSQVFNSTILDSNQLKNKELEFQNSVLDKMGESLEKYREQKETLSKINDKQKEEKTLNFEDKNQIKNFLQKQEEQEMLMEKFSKQLKESLSKDDQNNETKKMLQERLERQEMEARKNEKLLEELNKLADKIDKEELKKKLDELGKKQNTGARNLEQILELTKRYYVTEKASQLSKELDKLSKEQENISIDEKNNKSQDQKKLNDTFDRLAKELDDLKKDNSDLKKPLDIDVPKKQQDDVKDNQKDALEELNKSEALEQDKQDNSPSKEKASQKQKSAAQKMKEMSKSLQQSSMGGGGSSVTEDAEMLRQILDNLITFSFKQENLFEEMENASADVSQFSKKVRDQKELRRLFEHVDDSLFALSLRRAELSEFVNEQITEVYYNIDKSLENVAENQIYQSASYQQYVINATNKLADFLANILDNMQQSMQAGQGSGQSSGDFQLPDIIQGQQSIQEKMNGSGKQEKQGQSGQEGKKGEGKQGEGEKNGEGEGQKGKNEKNGDGKTSGDGNGKSGADPQKGNDGQGGNSSEEMGLSEIYEIYKEQQYLREQLEKQLNDLINKSDKDLAKKLIRQMEEFENQLLENGITNRTKNKVNTIQHQLLKLKDASLQQGKKSERESNANSKNYSNPITTKPDQLKGFQNDVEILNRQALPLHQNYQKRVKVYFKND